MSVYIYIYILCIACTHILRTLIVYCLLAGYRRRPSFVTCYTYSTSAVAVYERSRRLEQIFKLSSRTPLLLRCTVVPSSNGSYRRVVFSSSFSENFSHLLLCFIHSIWSSTYTQYTSTHTDNVYIFSSSRPLSPTLWYVYIYIYAKRNDNTRWTLHNYIRIQVYLFCTSFYPQLTVRDTFKLHSNVGIWHDIICTWGALDFQNICTHVCTVLDLFL